MAEDKVPKFEDTTPVWEETQALGEKVPQKDKYTPAEIALRQGSEGMTAGFYDELAGLVSAAGRPFGLKGLGGPLKEVSTIEPTLSPEDILKAYQETRDLERAKSAQMQKESPTLSTAAQIGGGLVTAPLLPQAKAFEGATLAQKALSGLGAGAAIGGLTGAGTSEADLTQGDTIGFGKDILSGAAGGAALGAGMPIVGAGLGAGLSKTSAGLGELAEKLAVKATGATGAQAQKFEERAGRELLNKNLVKFGNTVENIEQNVSNAVDAAGKNIDTALSKLDEQNVKISRFDIINKLKSKINELKGDESKSDIIPKIQSIVDDIRATGQPYVNISDAEKIKRGFGDKIANWADPSSGRANKEAYLTYMNAVEDAATEANPELADLFKDSKQLYKLLSPIQEASQRKVSQLNQRSLGLLDLGAAAAGGVIGGVPGAIATSAGKFFVAPRAVSSGAVTADILSKAAGKAAGLVSGGSNAGRELLKTGATELSGANSQEIQNIASKMVESGATEYASVLQKIANTPSEISKNAMIFSLMQQPDFRKHFNIVTGKKEDETSGK